MPYERSGRADKQGNRFEIKWTISKLLDVIEEKIQSVIIESLGEDEKGVDLWIVSKDGIREGQQCKGRNGSQEKWDFSSFNRKDIWRNWECQLSRSDNIRVSIVSPLNYTVLEDIAYRARNCNQKAEEFYNYQIQTAGADLVNQFNKICKAMNIDVTEESGLEKAIKYFSHIYVRQVPDSEMREEIINRIRLLFVGDPELVYGALLDYVLTEDIFGWQIDIYAIDTYIKKRNIEYRNLTKDSRLMPSIMRLNEDYEHFFTPLKYGFIERKETLKCLDYILEGKSVIIHGKAGIGKSGCTEDLIRRLKEKEIPYLAIKLDKNVPESNSEVWGEKLGLPASITNCIHVISNNRNAVIILDQLDALRWTQAHSGDALSICMQIIKEVWLLNKDREKQISIIFVCRSYDLINDGFISKLFADDKKWEKIEVNTLSDEELRRVVGQLYGKMSLRTKELLKIPSNLYIWERLDKNQSVEDVSATYQLVNKWWSQLIFVCRSKKFDSATLERIKNELVKYCYDERKMNIPHCFLNMPADYEEYLVSSGFLVVEKKLVSFVHQSILDCFFSEKMLDEYLREKKEIVDIIGGKSEQTPIKMYQVQMFFQQLFDVSIQDFIDVGEEILRNKKVRYSFKYIFIEMLTQINIYFENVEACILKLLNNTEWEDTIFNALITGSKTYLKRIRQSEYFELLIKRGETDKIILLFYSINPDFSDSDIEYLRRSITDDTIDNWKGIFSVNIIKDTDAFYEFRLEIYSRYPEMMENYFDFKSLFFQSEKRAVRLLSLMLKESKKYIKNSIYRHVGEFTYDRNDFLVNDYKYVLDSLLPFFPDVNDKLVFSNWSERHAYTHKLERTCVMVVKNASGVFAEREPQQFIDYFKFAYGKGSSLYNEIILDAMMHLDIKYADYILCYLYDDSFINAFENTSNNGNKLFLAKKLVDRFSRYCTESVIRDFEDKTISFVASNAKDILARRIATNRESKKNTEGYYVYWPFWGDLQIELLNSLPKNIISQKAENVRRVLSHRDVIYRNSDDGHTNIYEYDSVNSGRPVISPISKKQLTANNWLSIISSSKIESRKGAAWKHKGDVCIDSSARMYASIFHNYVSENPCEVVELLIMNKDVHIGNDFVEALFAGLSISNKTKSITEEMLIYILKRFGYDYDGIRAEKIVSIIARTNIVKYKNYFIDILWDIIDNCDDPNEEDIVDSLNENKDSLSSDIMEGYALNCARGMAIRAFSDFLWEDISLFDSYKDKIEALTCIDNPFINYATLFLLWPVYNYDKDWASIKILSLFEKDHRLVGFHDSRSMLISLYKSYPDRIEKLIRESFDSQDERVVYITGYTLVELNMCKDVFSDLIDLYVMTDENHRKPLLEMIINYFEQEEHRDKAKKVLIEIINIEDEENYFLWGSLFRDGIVDLDEDKDFIMDIMKSKMQNNIIGDFADRIIKEQKMKDYSDLIIDLGLCIMDASIDNSYIFGFDYQVSRLIIALYDVATNSVQDSDKNILIKCLDIWDKMYEKNVGIARSLSEQLMEV